MVHYMDRRRHLQILNTFCFMVYFIDIVFVWIVAVYHWNRFLVIGNVLIIIGFLAIYNCRISRKYNQEKNNINDLNSNSNNNDNNTNNSDNNNFILIITTIITILE